MARQGLSLFPDEVKLAKKVINLADSMASQAETLESSGLTKVILTVETNECKIKKDPIRTHIEFNAIQDGYFPESEQRTHFKVPNNIKGRAFIENLREYLNKETYSVKVRGRGPREHGKYDEDLPLDKAKTLAIYINYKD